MIEAPVYSRLIASVEATVAVASATLPTMPDDQFQREHQDVHAIENAPAVEIIAAVFEREYWRRWPEGRDEDDRP